MHSLSISARSLVQFVTANLRHDPFHAPPGLSITLPAQMTVWSALVSMFVGLDCHFGGTGWCSWLRNCATDQKVAGLIFYTHNLSDRTVTLGLLLLLFTATELSLGGSSPENIPDKKKYTQTNQCKKVTK
jgi:hypothetical protein